MIFKCRSIGRRYSGLSFKLIELCFLITLMTQNICARSYRYVGENTSNFENTDKSNITSRTNNNVANPRRRDHSQGNILSDSKIVFPGEERHVPVCERSTYCETVDSYPEHIVNKALERNESIKYLASVDTLFNVEQRLDGMEMALCISDEQVIFPQSAENKLKEWKFIANQENFKQGIRIEKCRAESTSCNVIGEFAAGYKTICKQKFIFRELQSVSADGSIAPDTFRFPSSCCCHVTFTGSPFPRIDTGNQSQITTTIAPTRKTTNL
ncbi:protein spaetzle-like [Bombus fervidus]|uniref:protein spaetzle-like n=1 Tax=Bombus fervidus TaxID=203811 RepID=UPI003AB84454